MFYSNHQNIYLFHLIGTPKEDETADEQFDTSEDLSLSISLICLLVGLFTFSFILFHNTLNTKQNVRVCPICATLSILTRYALKRYILKS